MAAFAQLKRDTMIERTRGGLVAAALNNRRGGRPRKVNDKAAAKVRKLKQQGLSAPEIARAVGVSGPSCTATSTTDPDHPGDPCGRPEHPAVAASMCAAGWKLGLYFSCFRWPSLLAPG